MKKKVLLLVTVLSGLLLQGVSDSFDSDDWVPEECPEVLWDTNEVFLSNDAVFFDDGIGSILESLRGLINDEQEWQQFEQLEVLLQDTEKNGPQAQTNDGTELFEYINSFFPDDVHPRITTRLMTRLRELGVS